MNLPLAPEYRALVEEFQRTHHIAVLTLVFTDLADSMQLKQHLGDHAGTMLLQQHHSAIRQVLSSFKDGQEISTAGDSFFIVFAAPSEAVAFSLRVQAALRHLAPQWPVPMRDRVGIHVGEVLVSGPTDAYKRLDLYGLQVDACARVMSLAQPGQILLTRFAYESAHRGLSDLTPRPTPLAPTRPLMSWPWPPVSQVVTQGLQPLTWLSHGSYRIKGAEEPLEIFEVGETGLAPLAPPPDTEKATRQPPCPDLPTTTSAGSPLSKLPSQDAPLPSLFYYISHQKIDRFLEAFTGLGAPLEPTPAAMDAGNRVLQLAASNATYGSPRQLGNLELRAYYARQLQKVLQRLAPHIVPLATARLEDITQNLYFWARQSFEVVSPDLMRNAFYRKPNLVATLGTDTPHGRLLLDCSLHYFHFVVSNRGSFQPTSDMSMFFGGGTSIEFETVFVMLDVKPGALRGSPLFLALSQASRWTWTPPP